MPALLTSTSIDWKRDSAASTTRGAVAGSPTWPSTRATRSDASTSADWVTFRELATTLKPRSTNPFTIPAPIPCEAPVTMAVFRGPLIVGVPSTKSWRQDAGERVHPPVNPAQNPRGLPAPPRPALRPGHLLVFRRFYGERWPRIVSR